MRQPRGTAASTFLTVGLLVASAGAAATELLGLATTRVSHQQAAVVLDQGLLDLALGLLVNILLVVRYNSLGDSLPDGCGVIKSCLNKVVQQKTLTIDLRGVTTSPNADADVDVLELLSADEKNRLEDLVTQGFRLEELDGVTVHLQETIPLLAVSNGDSVLLLPEGLHSFQSLRRHCFLHEKWLLKVNGNPIELLQPETLRYKIFEPVLLVGREKFKNIDIRIRVRGGGHTSQVYAIRQAIAKAIVAYYQKYVDEQSKREIKETLVQYDRSLLVADPRRCEPKKFGGRGARARYQKSYR